MEKTHKKAAIIYHSGDVDGLISAMLLKQVFYQYDIKLYPYNYETEGQYFIDNQTEFLNKYESITFVDVTPTKEWMENYCKHIFNNKYVVLNIIDHHFNKLNELENEVKTHYQKNENSSDFVDSAKNIISANDNINQYHIDQSIWIKDNNRINFYVSFTTNDGSKSVSAAFLSYCYLMTYGPLVLNRELLNRIKNIEYFVWLLSEYDVWNFTDQFYHPIRKKSVLELQEGISKYSKSLDKKNSIVTLFESNLLRSSEHEIEAFIDDCKMKGRTIIEQTIESQELKSNYFLCEAGELLKIDYPNEKFLIVIGEYPRYHTQEWMKEKFNQISAMLFIQIKQEKKLGLLSLRQGNNKGFDCIRLIKKLVGPSGGGHFGAAGGAIPINSVMKFINSNFNQVD